MCDCRLLLFLISAVKVVENSNVTGQLGRSSARSFVRHAQVVHVHQRGEFLLKIIDGNEVFISRTTFCRHCLSRQALQRVHQVQWHGLPFLLMQAFPTVQLQIRHVQFLPQMRT